MNRIDRLLKALANFLALAAGAAMVLMMAHIVADVAMKYLLNDPIDGTTEIVAAYYMAATVFLPLAYVAVAGEHLDVTLFTQRLRGRGLRLLSLLGLVATALYLGFICYHGVVEALRRTAEGEAWETSVRLLAVWPSRWFLPIGAGAMGLYILLAAVRTLRGATSVAADDHTAPREKAE